MICKLQKTVIKNTNNRDCGEAFYINTMAMQLQLPLTTSKSDTFGKIFPRYQL